MSCQAFISCASKVPEISSTASCHRSRGGQSRYPHPKRDRNAGCVKTHPAAMGLRGFAIASSMYSSKRRCCGPSARTKRLASPSQPRAGDVAPVRQLLRPRRVPQLLQLRQAPHDIERTHALRSHLRGLDQGARSLQARPKPAHPWDYTPGPCGDPCWFQRLSQQRYPCLCNREKAELHSWSIGV